MLFVQLACPTNYVCWTGTQISSSGSSHPKLIGLGLWTPTPGSGSIGVARGGQRGHTPTKFLENIVILCFERRFSKQNSVIRLESNILPIPKFFGPLQISGLATPLSGSCSTALGKLWPEVSKRATYWVFQPQFYVDQMLLHSKNIQCLFYVCSSTHMECKLIKYSSSLLCLRSHEPSSLVS